jgi:hypothetical protein
MKETIETPAAPETDAAQHEGLLRGHPTPTLVVRASFARNLERQRDEARELVRELRDALEAVMPYIVGDRIVPWKAAEKALTKAKEVLP